MQAMETPIRVGPFSGILYLERERFFRPVHRLKIYARVARKQGRITELTEDLDAAALTAQDHAGHRRGTA